MSNPNWWHDRIVVVRYPDRTERQGKIVEDLGRNPENGHQTVRVAFLHGTPREQVVVIGEEGMLLDQRGYHTHEVRRDPHPRSFAHAIRLDQFNSDECWLIIDAYGPVHSDAGGRLATDDEVKHWPPVYVPEHDQAWRERNG